ncbi:aminotransferase class IV [Candidatus Pelagibacter sp.]|nr:aminotransferase class IV [Candidatus Pelagibacter sp.]
MVKFLLKKSYSRKDLKEKDFKDLWNAHGVFTTMWIYGKPQKILFFKEHITNLIKSTKNYKIYDRNLKRNIFKIIKSNLNKQKNYNHLLRIAVTKSLISISLRDKLKIKKNLKLKLVNYNRINPEHKNLKYKFILKNLSKMDNTKSDIALCSNGKILETGTSNIIFIKDNKYYSPIKKFYRGVNLKFFEKQFKIKKTNININKLNQYEEILLIGSGKGVSTVSSIKEKNWKRKKYKSYETFVSKYQTKILKQKKLSNYL